LLADSVGGTRHIHIEARTLAEALDRLRELHPMLRAHVWDDGGALRQHVLVYLNDESVTWIDDHAARELRRGDELFIIQAVSGG
jgi:molybdopterin synthase sulfur carrier subunit